MCKNLLLVFLSLSFCAHINASPCKKTLTLLPYTAIVQQANYFYTLGTLEKENGYYYLALKHENFFKKLYQRLITHLAVQHDSCIHIDTNRSGPHISLFYPNDGLSDSQKTQVDKLIGQPFKIQFTHIYKFDYCRYHKGMRTQARVYAFRAVSPQLAQTLAQIKPHDRYLKELHMTLAFSIRYMNSDICFTNSVQPR